MSGRDTVNILGIEIDRVTAEDVLRSADRAVENRSPYLICTANVDHLVTLQTDGEFRRAYALASVVTADGAPVLWASRVLGRPIRERVTGADLAPALCDMAAARGYHVFILGGGPGVAAEARERLMLRWPALRNVSVHSPPYGFEKVPDALDRIDQAILEAAPDILLVALGSPKQEKWYAARGRALAVPVAIGCGAAVDFMAGRIPRAPSWMQRAGLEWLYRLAREPRRLWRRVLVDDPPFFRLVMRQKGLEKRGLPWVFSGDEGA